MPKLRTPDENELSSAFLLQLSPSTLRIILDVSRFTDFLIGKYRYLVW